MIDVFNSLMSKPVESEPVVIPLVAESESVSQHHH